MMLRSTVEFTLGLVLLQASMLNGQSAATIDANETMALSVENAQSFSWGSPLDGSNANQLRPTPVALPAAPIDISAGERFSLFLLPNGQVWGGGENGSGQLGRGFVGATAIIGPAGAVPLSIGIEAGIDSAYAWTATGQLVGWGNRNFLGTGPGGGQSLLPLTIPISNPVVDVAVNRDLVLALDNQGQVWGWGAVAWATTQVTLPTQIQGIPPIQSIAAGAGFGYAVAMNGQVFLLTSAALLPPGVTPIAPTFPPVIPIPGLPPIRSMSASEGIVAAADFSGDVWVIFSNFRIDGFQGGTATTTWPFINPVQIAGFQNIVELASNRSLYARDASGTMWVLGARNQVDGLGLGTLNSWVSSPARVPMTGPVPTVTISTSQSPTCPTNAASPWPPSLPALGGSIAIRALPLPNPLLFLAPGPATTALPLPSGCALSLDIPGLTRYLNAGIGPFAAQAPTVNAPYHWRFSIPDSPTLAGFTITAQAAWTGFGMPGTLTLGPAYTFVLN